MGDQTTWNRVWKALECCNCGRPVGRERRLLGTSEGGILNCAASMNPTTCIMASVAARTCSDYCERDQYAADNFRDNHRWLEEHREHRATSGDPLGASAGSAYSRAGIGAQFTLGISAPQVDDMLRLPEHPSGLGGLMSGARLALGNRSPLKCAIPGCSYPRLLPNRCCSRSHELGAVGAFERVAGIPAESRGVDRRRGEDWEGRADELQSAYLPRVPDTRERPLPWGRVTETTLHPLEGKTLFDPIIPRSRVYIAGFGGRAVAGNINAIRIFGMGTAIMRGWLLGATQCYPQVQATA